MCGAERSRVMASVAIAAMVRLTASSDVFAEVAAAMPRAKPERAARRGVSGLQTRMAIAASQLAVQSTSVRNSIEQRKKSGATQPITTAQIAARLE